MTIIKYLLIWKITTMCFTQFKKIELLDRKHMQLGYSIHATYMLSSANNVEPSSIYLLNIWSTGCRYGSSFLRTWHNNIRKMQHNKCYWLVPLLVIYGFYILGFLLCKFHRCSIVMNHLIKNVQLDAAAWRIYEINEFQFYSIWIV